MKKLLTAVLIMVLALASLASCSPKKEESGSGSGAAQESAADETAAEDESAGESTAKDGAQSLGALTASEYPSYADALKANEAAIRADGQDWQGDVNGDPFENNVLLYDLNGDGESELILMLGTEMGGVLHILTMKDGKAVECEYDVVPIVQYVEKNEVPFKFIFAGGGSDYMMYAGKERGTFYIAYNVWDSEMHSSSTMYIMRDDGLVRAETRVENTASIEPADTPVDEYKISGNDVSAEDGAAAFKAHREDYKDLLMYNMKYGNSEDGNYHEDFMVFRNLETDAPLASGYDEVMKQLGE